jgi:predicted glycoside hydrolase/deacetylase ChbG (UPF0249 family)
MLRKIINADDFGASREVNEAIARARREGCLNSASLMADGPHAAEAAEFARANPDLSVGVHLELEGGFAKLLLRSIFARRALKRWAESEMRRQIEKARGMGIKIAHLDSHRHVHMIPALFDLARKLQKEYKIPRLRVVNESFIGTFAATRNWRCFFDGGFVKYAVLKSFYYLNGARGEAYFYSIAHTMHLWGRNVRRIRVPKGFKAVEIGIHPSTAGEGRRRELATCMDREFPGRIISA